ncbi:MAG: PD40 domain-containing protein, partial [Proteobacteria bacterium]|nr:PD40 domain-containing protein [Pseudomonadota bacterium]
MLIKQIGQQKKKFLKLILVLSIFFASAFHNNPASAGVMDSSFKFSTIETDHFYLHYHQGLDKIAGKASLISEEAHRDLTSVFKWEPLEKTHIVLIDSSDFINGFATILPQNMIYIQVVPPSEETPIGEYDDWLKMVIIHEYSHMLALDPVRGYSKVMRDIFGRPIPGSDLLSVLMFFAASSPNIFLPRWWHEGIATWSETEHTEGGRGRSALYDMIFRMAVEEGNIPSIDQLNGDMPDWPAGRMPYIFGLRLHKYIIDQYGAEAVGKMNMSHAGRAPYFLNGVPKRLFQRKHYVRLYKEMIEALIEEQNKRIETLRSSPFTEIQTFELEGELLTSPRYSPDGTMIAYNKQDPHGHKAIMLINSDGTGEREVIRRLPSDQGIAWSPDGSRIYFSQAEFNKGFNVYQDLYYYDLKRAKLKRLTQGLRLGNPDISPDGKIVAAIASHRGSQNVAILALNKDNKVSDRESSALDVITDHELVRVSNPRWSPDGTSLVYTIKENNGTSGLYLYDLSKREEKSLLHVDHDIAYPAWSGNGDYIIYTSDERGVYNLFAYSIKTGESSQVTHVLGGAFQPHLSPRGDKIVFSSYNSKGSKIAVTDFRPESFMAEAGPIITPYWNNSGDENKGEHEVSPMEEKEERKSDIVNGNESDISRSKPYSALKTLKPRFWLPTLFGDHDGAVTGAMTAGQDVLGYNTYLLEVDYGISSKESYYNAAYVNNYAYPTFILQAYSRPLLYSDFFEKGDF